MTFSNQSSNASVALKVNRKFTGRQERAMQELVSVYPGWVRRKRIDYVTGASNGPQVIAMLRHVHGFEIEMRMVAGTDRFGSPCESGEYSLTTRDMEKLVELGLVTRMAP